MTVTDLVKNCGFEIIHMAEDAAQKPAGGIYCCDLLSIAMAKGVPNAVWVTIMGNINTVAVAALTEMSCVVLADGAAMDDKIAEKAKAQDITVVKSALPIFETALKIHGFLHG